MASVTCAIPDNIKSEMKELAWVNWSELVRKELTVEERRDKLFERFDEILKDSKMTDELAFKLADELKKKVAKRHGL